MDDVRKTIIRIIEVGSLKVVPICLLSKKASSIETIDDSLLCLSFQTLNRALVIL